ncbi:hypothetical protein [Vagococcus fluvialis]|uniref:hypothetical protein n=1 Tax=Vagococcus fluvialis TaxID=2738 RepID=UPI001D0B1BB1|nr:hypothetical protein [Vagococcus fluvialis]UDM70708.1 hypothetical protein K5L00_11335 [Vagococcus fluvialis]UDM78127.1 hypothetical protein K5K98_06870 [Vagococcus fluvialis]UDM82396.1 hypothetical protein K5K96_13810 [Vagococcus fluvialis]
MKKVSLLGILFLSALSIIGCSSNNSNNSTIDSLKKENEELKSKISYYEKEENSPNDTSESSSANISSEIPVFKSNEEAFIADADGNKLYSLKILKATTNLSETNEAYTDGKPQNTIEVTYEYKNYLVDKPMLVSSQYVNAFDSNGLAGKNMSMMDGQTEVTKDRASQSTVWFVMQNDMTNENSVEIEYANDFSLGFDSAAKFEVPLEH